MTSPDEPGRKYTKGEDAQDYLSKHLELEDYIVLASTPEDEGGGFNLVMGDPAMIVSLFVMFFKNYPELLMATFSSILKIYATMTHDQIKENADKVTEGCNCESCAKGKATDGTLH